MGDANLLFVHAILIIAAIVIAAAVIIDASVIPVSTTVRMTEKCGMQVHVLYLLSTMPQSLMTAPMMSSKVSRANGEEVNSR